MSSLAHKLVTHRTSSYRPATATDEQTVFDDAQVAAAAYPPIVVADLAVGNVALVTTIDLQVVALAPGINVIGRDKSCCVVVQDPIVSRRHAQIAVRGNQLVLTDLHSTNGTWVNGQRVATSIILRGGDRIKMGRIEFVVSA